LLGCLHNSWDKSRCVILSAVPTTVQKDVQTRKLVLGLGEGRWGKLGIQIFK